MKITPGVFDLEGARRVRGKVDRVRQMTVPELAYRGRQEASKWLERLAPAGLGRPEALLRVQAPDLADPERALQVLRTDVPRRFFAGPSHRGTTDTLWSRFPDGCRAIIDAANDIVVHRRFDLLGYRGLQFGEPIDWHFDPVWGRRAPVVHWSRLDPLDPLTVGDSKVIWELNRHQWLVRLAQAWSLTGDERHAVACVQAMNGWFDQNPPGVGINWASSLEVAYRLISWSWMLVLLREWPHLPADWLLKVYAAIWFHAAHVSRYLSQYFSPNTHLTGEALGLVYAGLLLPEFKAAARWRELGLRILISESGAQIHADGVHFEQSTCYHRYTVDIYLHLLLITTRNGVPVSGQIKDRVSRMLEFLMAVRRPDGSIPSIGDADGGQLLPLRAPRSDTAQGVFGPAAALFRRPELAWAAGGLTPEVLWLMGLEGLHAFESIAPAPPSGDAARVFPTGGYAIVRADWDPEAHQAVMDIGPLGCHVSAGHGHADLLSLQCSIFGEPCLVDAGTFCYTPDPEWRDFFRSTAAHSTVMVDGRGQAEPAGPFGWRERPRVRLREWHSSPDFDFVDADHEAYADLPEPVVHRRRLIFVKPSFWILVDDLHGTGRHRIDLGFQFAPMTVRLGPGSWTRAETPRGRVLWLSSFPWAPIQTSLKCGELSPRRGWISDDYGRRQPAPMLVYSCDVALPWRILTVLLPDRRGLASPPAARPIFDVDGRPEGVAFDRPRRTVRFDDRSILIARE